MNKTSEISLLESALNRKAPVQEIENLCKIILRKRVDIMDSYDQKLQDLIISLLPDISIPVKTTTAISSTNDIRKNNIGVKILLSLLGGLGMCFLGVRPIPTRLLGGVFCLVSGYGLKSSFTSVPVSSSSSLVCTSTASELIEMIDVIFDKIQVLLNHNQLEGRHKDVLVWLQRLYSDSEDDKFEREILKLMSLLGYEFIEYNSGDSENFEVSSANVEEVVTAKYAVRNKSTGAFVLSGVVVFPK